MVLLEVRAGYVCGGKFFFKSNKYLVLVEVGVDSLVEGN